MEKKNFKPRKHPVQKRSKVLTQEVVNATARILSTDGFESLTTNKVAIEAHVSVGSLYQYFPNKESLILAVIHKILEEDEILFRELTRQTTKSEIEKTIDFLLEKFLITHSCEHKLRTEIYSQFFRLGASKEVLALRQNIIRLFSNLILAINPKFLKSEAESRAFVLFHSVFGVMQAIAIEQNAHELQVVKSHLLVVVNALTQ